MSVVEPSALPTAAQPTAPPATSAEEVHGALPVVQLPERSAVAVPPVAPLDERVFAVMSPAGTTAPSAPRAAPARPAASPAARVGVDWASWALTSLVMTAFFVLIVSGRVVTEGPVLVVLSATHGIHEGDLFALAATCAGIALPVLRGLRRR